jgi:chromosome segregation ATPase
MMAGAVGLVKGLTIDDALEENEYMREQLKMLQSKIASMSLADDDIRCKDDEISALLLERNKEKLLLLQEQQLVAQLASSLKEMQTKLTEEQLVVDSLKVEVLELLPLRLKLQNYKDSNDKLTTSLRVISEEKHLLKASSERLKVDLEEKTQTIEALVASKVGLENKVKALERETLSMANDLESMNSQVLKLQDLQASHVARLKELSNEKEELLIQKSLFERKSISLSREVSRLVSTSTSYLNTLDELKDENKTTKLKLRDEALESLISPIQDNREDHLDCEHVADDNCFVFLFGGRKGKESKADKQDKRGKSNVF